MVRLGERLKWVREIMGKTQQEMADMVGIQQSAWCQYETGRRSPDAFQAVRIAAKMKISVDYLLSGSLDGVERNLAIQLVRDHPELAPPRNKGWNTGTALLA